MAYKYEWLPGRLVPEELIEQMSQLYSSQYGCWSRESKRNPGGAVRLPPAGIMALLVPDVARVAYAVQDNEIVGCAIAIQAKVPDYGFISWVTQLVVHQDHRQQNIAKSLLFAIWTFTDHFAWGAPTSRHLLPCLESRAVRDIYSLFASVRTDTSLRTA